MKRHFCTLFDKNYLYQGVALYRSLERHAGDFILYALCMDEIAYSLLCKMKLPNLIGVQVDDLLTHELAAVRRRTTHGQFCWVCQPIICQYVLARYEPDMVTYLEADSLFFSSPEPLFEELGPRSVSLVPHSFSREFNNSAVAGKFCVQFNAFRNDDCSRKALELWKESCFKYDQSQLTAYPGQKTLEDWPNQFGSVAVIEHQGAGVAPWNIRGYELTVEQGTPYVNGVPVVFFHFHQYGRLKSGAHELGSYPITSEVVESFYRPYVLELRAVELTVQSVDPAFIYRREYSDRVSLSQAIRTLSIPGAHSYMDDLIRKLRGRYNIYPNSYFEVVSGEEG